MSKRDKSRPRSKAKHPTNTRATGIVRGGQFALPVYSEYLGALAGWVGGFLTALQVFFSCLRTLVFEGVEGDCPPRKMQFVRSLLRSVQGRKKGSRYDIAILLPAHLPVVTIRGV